MTEAVVANEEQTNNVVTDEEGNQYNEHHIQDLIDKKAEEQTDDSTPSEKKDEVERPEWLPEKFKTAEDLAKSYKNLEKKLGEQGKIAPEKYEPAEDLDVPQDEFYDEFAKAAKEAGLNNDQFNSVVKFAKDAGLLDVPDVEQEIAKLGDEKDVVLDSIRRFGQAKLSKDESQRLFDMVTTADNAKLLYKVIRSNNTIPAIENKAVSEKKELQSELATILSNPDIQTDVGLKEKAEQLAKQISNM